MINLRYKHEAILQELANPRTEKQKLYRRLLATELNWAILDFVAHSGALTKTTFSV